MAINLLMVTSLVTIWLVFAPTRIGGQASYVIIDGNSMEPLFHRGDLVIIKKAARYEAGDIVTYSDSKMRAFVIHRIIAVEQDYFILKGDNNSWIDAYRPTKDEIIGKFWIHIPKLGETMKWLRTPINLALAIGILGGILMAGPITQPHHRGNRRNKPPTRSMGWFEATLYALGFLTLAFLALTIFSLGKPVEREADDIKYEQTGVYYYSAAGAAGIYDTETLHSGDPIFPRLTCVINIGYSYNLSGQMQEVSGTQQIDARISDEQSGWQRTIPLQPETAFSGNSYTAIAPVDLCQVQALVSTVEEGTGFRPNTYTLTIISQTSVTAKADGNPIYDSFTSSLVFEFDKVHFYLAGKNNESDPLQSSKSGKAASANVQPNSFRFLGLEWNVFGLRVLSLGGLGLSLLCLLIFGWYVLQATKRDPQFVIQVKHSSLLMDIYEYDFEKNQPLVEAASIDALAKLAERQNSVILHMTRDRLHYYFVKSDGTTYYYMENEKRNTETNHAKRTEMS
ncbi:MAG: signal peptidase I [Chloroflexi bacterium]|nr:signal peptidase I [Chloroflexota bacterium]